MDVDVDDARRIARWTRFVGPVCLVLVLLNLVLAVVNFAQGDLFHGSFFIAFSFLWGVPILAVRAWQGR